MITPDAQIHVLETLKGLWRAAMAADANATSDVDVSVLWKDLARGSGRVVDGFFSETRCYLVLSPEANKAAPVEGRRLEILQAVLGGLRQKNIAIDLKLAPSTVALNSRLALESLGVGGKPSRAHPLLMLAAQAARSDVLVLARRSTFLAADGLELTVVSIPRPDRGLDVLLPNAELSVIRRLVEGLSYDEIARHRGTSTRTIANQITAVFRRLKVSGRNELVQRLFVDEIASHSPDLDSSRRSA